MPFAAQFASYLKTAREKAGLTQTTLAERCGLTGSYISLLESGKKPAPSDRVVRRLASVLDLRSDDALQVAHLDRAPEDLRRAVERLRRQAALERELRQQASEALFPLSIWNLGQGPLPHRLRTGAGAGLDAGIVEAIDHLQEIARASLDLPAFHREAKRVLDGLPGDQRRKILDVAPVLAEGATASAGGRRHVPAPEPGCPPEVRAGDILVVDEAARPEPGDLVLLEENARREVRPWEAGLRGVVGVVVEVRRRLRRPSR
jgi:transcriptional regulator with XRE-family HTH domain